MKTANKSIGEAVVAMRLSTFKRIMSDESVYGTHSAGVMALVCPDGILLVNDLAEPHGTVVIEHTSQGFLARQKGEEK